MKSVGDERVEQIWAFQWHHQCGLSACAYFEMWNAGYPAFPDWMDKTERASCFHPTFNHENTQLALMAMLYPLLSPLRGGANLKKGADFQ